MWLINGFKEQQNIVQFKNLDQSLFGIWKNTDEPTLCDNSYQYYRSFSSNGMWNSWTIRTYLTNTGSYINYTEDEDTGSWWSQDNYFFSTISLMNIVFLVIP